MYLIRSTNMWERLFGSFGVTYAFREEDKTIYSTPSFFLIDDKSSQILFLIFFTSLKHDEPYLIPPPTILHLGQMFRVVWFKSFCIEILRKWYKFSFANSILKWSNITCPWPKLYLPYNHIWNTHCSKLFPAILILFCFMNNLVVN